MNDIVGGSQETKGAQGIESKDESKKDAVTTLYNEVVVMKGQVKESIDQIKEQRAILFLGYIICLLMVATIFVTFLIFLFDRVASSYTPPQINYEVQR